MTALNMERTPTASEADSGSAERETPDNRSVERAIHDIDVTRQFVVETLGLDPDSPETVREIDDALVHVAESEVGAHDIDAPDAVRAVLIEGALEVTGAVDSSGENPAARLDHILDSEMHQMLTEAVVDLGHSHAELPDGVNAAEAVIAAVESHSMSEQAQGLRHTQELVNAQEYVREQKIAFVSPTRVDMLATEQAKQRAHMPERMQFAMVRDTSDILAKDKKNEVGAPDADENWREKTFGKESIAELRADTVSCLEQSVPVRAGEPLLDKYTGAERRPIMDIQLDDHAKACVQEQIARRSEGLDKALEAIAEIASHPENRRTNEYEAHALGVYMTALQDLGVWSRQHGNLLRGESSVGTLSKGMESPGGTVADLYIDEGDLAKYKQIDIMINEATMLNIDSSNLIADGIANLAAHTFPSGVEMVHALPPDSLEAVIHQGSLAPRSQVMHGVDRTTQLNGGFTHMTMPGTAAYEYSHGRATVVGIPIDTVIAYSPYMQLEHAYTGNEFRRSGDSHSSSTQYEMGAMVINDISTAPRVFQAALGTMRGNLDDGMSRSNIRQGDLNNVSFAATNEATTAAAYQYPLEALSIYSEDYDTIRRLAEKFPEKADTIYGRTKVVASESQGRPIGAIDLPNFSLEAGQPLKVYAPMSSAEVGFTEGAVGNSFNESTQVFSRETIVPGKEAKFMNELIESGMTPAEVTDIAIDAINNKGGFTNDIFKSYAKNPEVYEAAGMSAASLVGRLDSSKFNEIIQANMDYPWGDDEFVSAYAARLYDENPTSFALNAEDLQSKGYVLNTEQVARVQSELNAIVAKGNELFEIPKGPTF